MKHEIEIPDLPEGWRAVAYRKALWGEWYLTERGTVRRCGYTGMQYPALIVEQIKPRRILLEETGEIAIPKNGDWVLRGKVFQQSDGNDFRSSHRIWREVKEGERSSTTFREDRRKIYI